MDNIAVIIPCYNESLTIKKVVNDFFAILPENSNVYVYDNNSTDDSFNIAMSTKAIVRKEKKQGKGNVIRRAFREINARCYIMADADDAYSPQYAITMANMVLNDGYDIVIGDRLSSNYYKDQNRAFHGFGNKLVKFLVNKLFVCDIHDIMSGCRALSYAFVKTYPVFSSGFELETEMSVHAAEKRMAIGNIVIDFKERKEGSISSMNTFLDGFKVLYTIFSLFVLYKPFIFYTIIAVLLLIISMILFIPVFIYWINNSLVPNFPRMIISCFIALTSLMFFMIGVLLQTLLNNSRKDFEIEYIKKAI